MFVTWVSGVIPWSLATHVELGTWVSLSRAGVPKLIASSFCFSQDSDVGKSEVLMPYFLQHEAKGKGNILTLGSVKNTVLYLPCDINYLSRLQIRLTRDFTFNAAIPFLPGVGCCPGNCISCSPELFSHSPKPLGVLPAPSRVLVVTNKNVLPTSVFQCSVFQWLSMWGGQGAPCSTVKCETDLSTDSGSCRHISGPWAVSGLLSRDGGQWLQGRSFICCPPSSIPHSSRSDF